MNASKALTFALVRLWACSFKRSISYTIITIALLTLTACDSSQLTSIIQGSNVPVVAKTSADVNEQNRSRAAFPPITTPTPTQTPTDKTSAYYGQQGEKPSLIPYLTGQKPPQNQVNPIMRLPIAPQLTLSTVRIGLLIPLSGPNEKLGRSLLNAAQMALFDFSDSRFELLIFDTLGTSEGALEAARFAIEDGVSVILGPLLGTSISAIAPVSQAANVKVIGFSSDRTVTGEGIYTMGFFPENEVKRVVDFAVKKGKKRFAAIAPSGLYGHAVVEALRYTVTKLGAEVDQILFYDTDAKDFSDIVRELANYDIRRQALLDQRSELKEREDDIAKKALKRLEKMQTLGEVPFDTLLLAGGGEQLFAIAALLPFYDIDPKKVRVLGTGQWDMSDLGVEPALRGGWHAGPPPEARADFVKHYKNIYGVNPHRLSTLAYDATALVAVMARGEGGADFSNEDLTAKSGFWGSDGLFRFLNDGTVQRGLAVLQVEARSIKVISSSPQAFND
jgi:ABC-type branched-subunit amino acid transport system substrate-binding protein